MTKWLNYLRITCSTFLSQGFHLNPNWLGWAVWGGEQRSYTTPEERKRTLFHQKKRSNAATRKVFLYS